MASRPEPGPDEIPAPDIIEPQSPDETPPPATPRELPATRPDEIHPVGPDYDQPDRAPPEFPPGENGE